MSLNNPKFPHWTLNLYFRTLKKTGFTLARLSWLLLWCLFQGKQFKKAWRYYTKKFHNQLNSCDTQVILKDLWCAFLLLCFWTYAELLCLQNLDLYLLNGTNLSLTGIYILFNYSPQKQYSEHKPGLRCLLAILSILDIAPLTAISLVSPCLFFYLYDLCVPWWPVTVRWEEDIPWTTVWIKCRILMKWRM